VGGTAPAADAAPDTGATRPERPQDERQLPNRFDKGGRGDQGGRPPRHDGERGKDRERDKERERGKDRERPPRKPEPVADPDSPFAKLAALKADLEKRARER
jgi:ATP-dependent RNA helicase SUPV3L1/SUV3